jgi:hypothetical protein
MADPCKPILDRIAALQAGKRALQADLRTAPPSEKALLIRLIREADASLREASADLRRCRSTSPAPVLADIRMRLSSCLSSDNRRRLEQALTDAFADEDGIAHSACLAGDESIGVWAPSRGEETARRASLDLLPPIKSGESFGQVVERDLIKRKVRESWDAQPKAFNDDGEADSEGPNFLTSLSYRMEAPNRVITTTEGFRRTPDPFPNIEFTATTTDTLDTEAGVLHCDTTTDVDADLDVAQLLLELFTAGPLGVVRGLFRIASDIWDSSLGPDVQQGGVGCSVLALFPTRISLGGGFFAQITYTRVETAPGGFILAGGTQSVSGPT